MMNRKLLLILCLLLGINFSFAQEQDFAFGFYGDMQVEDAAYDASFGVQGKYEYSNYQGLQAQIHGRGDFVAVGADYILQFLNKENSNFNVFLGAGLSQEFYRYELAIDDDIDAPFQEKENFTKAVGQLGVGYYFPVANLSLYTGYKLKYQFKNELTEPNYIMLGLRYHIW